MHSQCVRDLLSFLQLSAIPSAVLHYHLCQENFVMLLILIWNLVTRNVIWKRMTCDVMIYLVEYNMHIIR